MRSTLNKRTYCHCNNRHPQSLRVAASHPLYHQLMTISASNICWYAPYLIKGSQLPRLRASVIKSLLFLHSTSLRFFTIDACLLSGTTAIPASVIHALRPVRIPSKTSLHVRAPPSAACRNNSHAPCESKLSRRTIST